MSRVLMKRETYLLQKLIFAHFHLGQRKNRTIMPALRGGRGALSVVKIVQRRIHGTSVTP